MGVRWITDDDYGVCVSVITADDMGLGKTLTMISLMMKQRADGNDKVSVAAGTKSTDSGWLSTGQKGASNNMYFHETPTSSNQIKAHL